MKWKDILANGELIPISSFPKQQLQDKNKNVLYFYANSRDSLIMEQVNPLQFDPERSTYILRCHVPQKPAS